MTTIRRSGYVASAKLVPFRDGHEHAAVQPGSWIVTHTLGGPAAGTFTEVVFVTDGTLGADHMNPDVLDVLVHEVALQLYGRHFAFVYPSAEKAGVEEFGMQRRETVTVTDIHEEF